MGYSLKGKVDIQSPEFGATLTLSNASAPENTGKKLDTGLDKPTLKEMDESVRDV